MFNLVKYEIKGIYKSILAILAGLAVLFAASMITAPFKNLQSGNSEAIGLLIIILSFFALGVATFVIVFLNSIKSMGKYLYNSDGYLMFTTPESGSSIIGSRLIVSLLQILIVNLAFGLFLYFALFREIIKMANAEVTVTEFMNSINPGVYAYASFGFILSVSVLLLTIYFSMVLSKSLIPFQKHQGLIAFITFIVMNILINYIDFKVNDLIPINLQLTSFNVNSGVLNIGNVTINNDIITLGIGSLIFSLIVSALLFLGSAYLIDNKLEL